MSAWFSITLTDTNQMRYFRLLATRTGREAWMLDEFLEGRVRFGWSPKGTDLHAIRRKEPGARSDQEKVTWTYTKFLIERIVKGDRIVLQLGRPLREFLIAEVTGEYQVTDDQDDFNHYLECEPLTPKPVPMHHEAIPNYLLHDLRKRGNYYEVYSENSKQALDRIVRERLWESSGNGNVRRIQNDLLETREQVLQRTARTISERWKAKDFEKFVAELLQTIPGVDVKEQKDKGKGWDMRISITDPISNSVIHELAPVQCKNYYSDVYTEKPFDDLDRCIGNSESSLAYLFILGNLPEEFDRKMALLESKLHEKLGRAVNLIVVDQERIAELYLDSLASRAIAENE